MSGMETGTGLGMPNANGGRRPSSDSVATTDTMWSDSAEESCWQKLKGMFGRRGSETTEPRRSIELYTMPASPRCRAVLMTARQLNIPTKIRKIDIFKNEHTALEFSKINPMHTLPTIVDGEFVLWESAAIMTYLSNKYSTYDSIYPNEPESRAVVDRLLYFDMNQLFRSIQNFVNPQLFRGRPPDVDLENIVNENLGHVELFLVNNRYVAGHSLTIADFATLSSITHLELIDYKIKGFPMIQDWLRKLKNRLPFYYEVNQGPLDELKSAVRDGLVDGDMKMFASLWNTQTLTESKSRKRNMNIVRNRVRVKPMLGDNVSRDRMTPLHI